MPSIQSRGCVPCALAVLATQLLVAVASANGPVLERARVGLARYDLQGDRTVGMLQELSEFLVGDAPQRALLEARYIRAVATIDMLVAARVRSDSELEAKLAAVFAVSPQQLLPKLQQELDEVDRGVYRVSVQEARPVLSLLTGQEAAFFHPRGPRRDLLLAHSVVTKDATLQSLASAAPDPCPEQRSCAPPYAGLDAPSRRTLAFLQEADRALRRVKRATSQGDPLGRALAREIENASARLRSLEVPINASPEALTASAFGRTEPVRGDVLVRVSAKELSYGFAPSARLGDDGTILFSAPGQPRLPARRVVRLPRDFKPWIGPIAEVERALRPSLSESTLTVGVSVVGSLKAHVLARVLLSLRRAGGTDLRLMGRTKDGALAGVPVRVVWGKEIKELPESALGLRLRLGRFSLRKAQTSIQIERIRVDGRRRFDFETLAAKVGRPPRSASLSFMANAPAGTLVTSAFHIVPKRGPVTLLVP
ncbi:MAG: hypothetical protein MJD61_18935 [Proteobacteria bacterium]|nr:hypothetical protein [Pseudomonadota bacterium]